MQNVPQYKLPDRQVEINYRPQGRTLAAFHKQRGSAHTRILIGPLGSGKTQSCIAECLQLIDQQEARPETTRLADDSLGRMPVRRSRGVVARNTYTDLQNTTIKDWREWTDSLDMGRFVDGAQGKSPTWTIEYFKVDGTKVVAEVVFLAFDVEKDMRKARGIQASWVWANEIKEMNRNIINMLFGRTGRYPARSRQNLIGDCNAPDRDHWIGQLALAPTAPDNWWFGIQPAGVIRNGNRWLPNPEAENINNLPTNYYVNQVAGAREAYIRSNLANEFVFMSDGRAVHPTFNEQLHVGVVQPTAGIPLTLGIDFGRTPACAIMQRQMDGQWYVLQEIVTVNTSALTFGRHIVSLLNERYAGYSVQAWGDPAGDQQAQTRDETPFDMLRVAGLEATPCHTNDFEERITSLDDKLDRLIGGQPAILIHPDCVTLIKGLAGGYKYNRIQVSGTDRYADKPDKGAESHVCEACHYGLMGSGDGIMISLFNQDDEVSSAETWAPNSKYFS